MDPTHYWVIGRALKSAVSDLLFAFSIHTFSVPGQPCSDTRTDISAEVSCINMATSAAPDLPKLKVRCTSQRAPVVAHFCEVPPLDVWYSFGCG